jgi:hypothetical protein
MSAQEITLAAEDAEDLEIISARLQDAVAQVKDLVWLPKSRRFAGVFNRFKWETAEQRKGPGGDLRVRAGLHFDGVSSAKALKLDRTNPDAVVALLAIRFSAKGDEDPAGMIDLVFAGGGAIRLEVECIDAGLSDLGGEWAARGRPIHEGEET